MAAFPGLWIPFLSDDWAIVDAVGKGLPAATPLQDFRPLFMASFWLERAVWGLRPGALHLTNLALIAAAAVLVVRLARRYSASPATAALAGVLFAVHPWHVANAAWLAGRSDALFTVPYLGAWLLYDRWRSEARGWPLASLALFEVALLGKESAGSLPGVLLLIGLIDTSRRPSPGEWRRGLGPLLVLGTLHFLLRWLVLGGAGRVLLHSAGPRMLETLGGYGVATILPLDATRLAARPAVWTAVAGLGAILLGIAARKSAGRIPRLALGGTAVIVLLIGPSVVGFEERYLFLPTVGGAIVLASLTTALPPRGTRAVTVALLLLWVALLAGQWRDWLETARASEAFVAGLSEVARDPRVEEIALTNVPLFVRGGSVAGDFEAALRVRGERSVRLRSGVYLAQSRADQRLLDDGAGPAVTWVEGAVEARFRTVRGPFSYRVGKPTVSRPGPDGTPVDVRFVDGERTMVRIARDGAGRRAACLWSGGRLERLF